MNAIKNFNKAILPKFKKSLYFEGLRQLRIGGIVLAVLVALGSAREYLGNISFNTKGAFPLRYSLIQELPIVFSDTAWLVFFLCAIFAVIAAFTLTSFTRSAKARDFYYATPHAGGTLWLNFAAACLTWIAAGAGSFLLVSCLFLMPFDAKIFGVCLFIACNVLAAVFMVFAMAMLAISLTGRLINALVNLLGLSVISTCVKIAFSEGYGKILGPYSLVVPSSELYEYDPVYHVYKRLFFSYGGSGYLEFNPEFAIFASWSTVGYCLLWGCVMLAAAALFMILCTGDSVGHPFVNKAAHVISLTVDYFPVGVLTAMIIEESIIQLWRNVFYIDGSNILNAIFILTLVCGSFWGLELLLTFDIRHSHRAFRLMPIPIVIPLAIIAVGFYEYKAEFNTTPTANEVESFTLVRNDTLPDELVMFRLTDTLGRWVTDEAEIKDKEIIEYATSQIKDLSDFLGHDLATAYVGEYEIPYRYPSKSQNARRLIALKLNLKNGRSITRLIAFDNAHIKALQNAFLSDNQFMKQFLALPDADHVNAAVLQGNGLTKGEIKAIYESFMKEYNALSQDEKLEFIKKSMHLTSRMNSDEDEYSEEPAVEAVTASDISLISQSSKPGQYGIVMSDLFEDYAPEDSDISIDIIGYPEGHLYEYEKWYDYTLYIGSKNFPNTTGLIVRTCNAKFAEAQKSFMASAKAQRKFDYRAEDLSVSYISKNKILHVDYVLLTSADDESVLNCEGKKELYASDDESPKIIKEVKVDSDAMVRQLFEDIQATDTIDTSKPYARIVWTNFSCNGLPMAMNFYAQTDFPDAAA